jgi:3-oxoacyl-[acyl-carrier-protein] synthase II
VLPATVPVTAFKANLGHTLAASGVLEAIGILGMMQKGQLWPVLHLDQPLDEGRPLNLVRHCQAWTPGPVLKNSFAFGGINASLILTPGEN